MRKIRNLILTFLLMFMGVVSINALTSKDMENIENKIVVLVDNSTIYDNNIQQHVRLYFKEGEIPNVSMVGYYLLSELKWDEKYILNPNYYENNDERIKSQIPANVLEQLINDSFVVTDEFYVEFRENYKNFFLNAEYKEIDGKYYYYAEFRYNMGGLPPELFIKGYKDLGNSQYQIYFYFYYSGEEEFEYATSKIEYKDQKIKYLSYEGIEEKDIPSDIISYKNIEDEEDDTTTDQEDTSKSNWDLLYEYFDERVYDDMFDSFEDIAILKDDDTNTMDITYIVEGTTYEMQYTYNNGVLTYSKMGSREYDQNFNTILCEFLINRFKYNKEKINIYLERTKGLTLEKDGVEYTLTEMYTEEEMQQMIKEWEDLYNSLTEEEKKQYQGIGFPNPLVYATLKVDLINGVKTYDEKLVAYYDIVEGEEQKFNSEKPEELVFKIDVDFELFDGVYMNGKLLDPKYYTAKEGSTIITLKKDYLSELNNGTHTIKVAFKDGEFAETTFTVEKTVKNPSTGIVFKYGLFALIGLVSYLLYLFVRKQSRFPKHN